MSRLVLLLPFFLVGCGLLGSRPPAPIQGSSPSTPAVAAAVTASPDAPVPAPTETAIKTTPGSMPWLKRADWGDLPGWRNDDLARAWPALQQSCKTLRNQSAWQATCRASDALSNPSTESVQDFLETWFAPHQIQQSDGSLEGLVTGYYEPLLRGSRTRSGKYRFPLYGPPDDLLIVDLAALYPELKNQRVRGRLEGNKVVPYYSRAELSSGKAPRVAGKEIAWADDPIELFFLEIQGSGRLQLENGDVMRVGYANQNGHPYKSAGKWLIEKGELTAAQASMQGIKDWARRNPERLSELLNTNPSQVFFRELPNNGNGPLGALGVPLTGERSIAVDPRGMPLGAPVWLATTQPNSSEPLNRLMLAQDTGGAIRGNVRVDFFWGFGEEAGKKAGAMKQKGRMWVLLPKDYPLLRNGN
ncbi:MAG: murein transglycosylase A [Betaproteobacteria bacterium]|nr:murein transglycosylase A [Betaproteobacteria bacterium]